jgi:stage IV sporulation protein FB
MLTFGKTIPISIHPAFWIMAFAIGWLNTMNPIAMLIWVPVILLSVLIHELGHALTALLFGQRVSIDLMMLGGLTKRWGGRRLSLFQDFLVVLNGPLAGFVLCAISYFLLHIMKEQHSLWTYALIVAVNVNLIWTLVNLLPIQPLDGGKLFAIILESIFGFRGVKIALFISIALSMAMALLCFVAQMVLAGAFFAIFAFESYRAWRDALPVMAVDIDERLQQKLHDAEQWLEAGHTADAESLLREVRTKTGKGVIFAAATELLASAVASQGRVQEGIDLLESVERELSGQGILLLQQLDYRQQKWRQAADLSLKAFEVMPSKETSLLNARCYARLGDVQPALGWLEGAIREGLTDLPSVLGHPDFDRVRDTPEFSQRFS